MTDLGSAEFIPGCGESSARTATLIINHSCNLNCTYCYEGFKSDTTMPFSLAQHILEKEFDFVLRSGKYNFLCIDFMGGEPFLEFALMRAIAEWVWSEQRPVPYRMFVTTNGTLLTKDVCDWLRSNKERFKIGVSFDGTPTMHDRNRNGTSELVPLDFFKDVYPEQFCKMTISPRTVDTLAEGAIYLHARGFKFTANCGHGLDWSDSDYESFESQLKKLAEFYLVNPQYERIALLNLNMRETRLSAVPERTCGIGTSMVAYDVDGRSYPCPVFSPLTTGDTHAGEMFKDFDFDNPSNYLDQRCAKCLLQHLCSTCYAFNYKLHRRIHKREASMCRLTKICAQVYCWLRTEEIKQKLAANLPLSADDMHEAAGITYAYGQGFPSSIPDLTAESRHRSLHIVDSCITE